MSMTAMQTISGTIQSQTLNDNFSLIGQDFDAHLADYPTDINNETGTATEKVTSALVKGSIYVPAGEHAVTAKFLIQNGRAIRGAGIDKTIFLVDASSIIAGVLDLDTISNFYGADFTIKSVDNAGSVGVYCRGYSHDITFERVKVEGFGANWKFEGSEGTIPGIVTNLTLRDCEGMHDTAPTGGTFGFSFGDCKTGLIENCRADKNWLDGFKFRKNNSGLVVRHPMANFNGQSGSGGDGIDCYAGGNELIIDNASCNDNFANGIYIKSGELNTVDFADYGYVKKVIINDPICLRNGGSGLEVNRNSGAVDTDVLVSNVVINGGFLDYNGAYGLYLRARGVKLNGVVGKHNQLYGCIIATSSIDCELINVDFSHNCLGGGASNAGLVISGKRVRVLSGVIYGKDSDTIKIIDDYAGLVATHHSGIIVNASADEVYISRDVMIDYNLTSLKILSQMTTGILLIDHIGQGNPEGNAYGGEGSTYTRTNGNSVLLTQFIKTTGISTAGWEKVTRLAATQANSVATDVAGVVVDLNALIAKLKAGGLMQ